MSIRKKIQKMIVTFAAVVMVSTTNIQAVLTSESIVYAAINQEQMQDVLVAAPESRTSTTVKLTKVKNLTAKRSNNIVQLEWSKVKKAGSYRIYRATTANGTFTYIGSTKTTTYTDKISSNTKTYYYKVRAYKKQNGTKNFGAYSKIIKVGASAVNITGNNNSNNVGEAFAHDEYAKEVIRLINVERAKQGLSALTTTTNLQKAAYERAKETKLQFSHTRPDGTSCFTVLESYGIDYRTCGENIAYGQKNPQAVVEAWMNSEGHRANILNKNFAKVGIGVYLSKGTYYWTQLFTN